MNAMENTGGNAMENTEGNAMENTGGTAKDRRVSSEEAADLPSLSAEDLIATYRVGLRVRAAVTQCIIEMRKGTVRFWIGGPGEEVHGAATALAIDHFDRASGARPGEWHTAVFPHYRSDALAALLTERRSGADFVAGYFRQALGRATDEMTRGRQMVMHLSLPELGIMPVQSPLGMNLGKAAGYARGHRALGQDRVTVAICGDGTSSTSDFHEAFVAASLWQLPIVFVVTDNRIAISVPPEEGRGIRDYESYSRAFGGGFASCDGSDVASTYGATLAALEWARDNRGPFLLQANVPRLRGHSSSDGAGFSYDAPDPLLGFGAALVRAGVLTADQSFRRRPDATGRDYYHDHVLGSLMEEELTHLRETLDVVRGEPAPIPGDEEAFSRPPFPDHPEPAHVGTTAVQINEALNLCLDRILAEGNSLVWGQDVAGDKGGVFKVTRGLSARYPGAVTNAPINEPLIVGTAIGAAHHPKLRALPEIQFGDYSLNTLHWLVHGGNIYWGSGGAIAPNVTLRMPTEPVQGGALYHSMCVDGYFSPVQGWVICCPSTSFDAYGLLRAAADYPGPVMMLEPKILYRRAVGPALPGEPSLANVKAARRQGGESLLDAKDLVEVADFRIPFGKAAVRRLGGDVTLVAYGNAALQAIDAAAALARDGIEATVLDLRTLSPWDHEAVIEAGRRTGRVVIAHQDRTFAGFGREVQGTLHEAIDGIATVVVGMRNVPAVGMAKELEEHTILTADRIASAARRLCGRAVGAFVANDDAWLSASPTRRRR